MVPDPDPPPPEPERPDDLDCCGNGCDPCIFDLYAQAQQKWRRDRLAWEERQRAATAASKTQPPA